MNIFLIDLNPPGVVKTLSADAQLVVWIGSVIVTILLSTIKILWSKHIESNKDSKEQDMSNILLLNELLNVSKSSGLDVSKLKDLIMTDLKPNLMKIELAIQSIKDQIK